MQKPIGGGARGWENVRLAQSGGYAEIPKEGWVLLAVFGIISMLKTYFI
jgi:hypothetical protein